MNLDLCSAVVFGGEGAVPLSSLQPSLLPAVLSLGPLREHKCKHIAHLCKILVSDHRQGINSTTVFCNRKYNRAPKLMGS